MPIELLRQTLPGVGVEVGVPAGWAREGEPEAASVRFLAAPRGGYRANLALSAGRLDPPTPAGFEALIEQLPGSFLARHPDAEIVTVRRFVHHQLPACLLRLRWTPGTPPPGADRVDTFEQLVVLVVTDPERGRLVQLDATTTAAHADEELPLLQAMIETLRPVAEADGPEQEAAS